MAIEDSKRLELQNLSKKMRPWYEWDKGQATTQAKLITSLLNHKGKATKFDWEPISSLNLILDQNKQVRESFEKPRNKPSFIQHNLPQHKQVASLRPSWIEFSRQDMP